MAYLIFKYLQREKKYAATAAEHSVPQFSFMDVIVNFGPDVCKRFCFKMQA